MIEERIRHQCPRCGSSKLVKNGKTVQGKQKYRCNSCRAYGTLSPSVRYPPERKAEILRAYHERSSMRGIQRTFGVSRPTLARWLRAEAAALPDSPPLVPPTASDELELDELWSFVGSKKTLGGSG